MVVLEGLAGVALVAMPRVPQHGGLEDEDEDEDEDELGSEERGKKTEKDERE